ncbi:MAG TPA: FG-GAP-like repeat-containing protein, partial [Gemmataceae bacterium]|nr:FG-GAP-like repeat-containing protein [Gemmataceae bacterium]
MRRSRWLPFQPRLEVLETRAVPAYVSASSIPGADGGTAMVTGDFNHDGKLDMAVADQGFNWVNVFLGNGDGTFQAPIKAATDKPVQGLTTADLNGDGNLDLVATSYNVSEACVMLGNGDGTFKLGVDYTSGGQPYQVLVADINGDGKPDILTADTTDTKIGVLWGRGDGTFLVGTPVTVPHAPVAMALGHFFGDSSKLDIAFGCSGDDTNLYIVRGNGDGTFQPAVKIEANVDTGALATADLNGDGKLDLVDYASRDNQIQVFMGNGNGTFQAPVIYPAGSCYSSTQIQLVDIRHNGKLDLITVNPGSNDLSVYLGNGDGTFQPPTNYVAGVSPDCLAVGDFNRDGMLDIAAADYMGGDFAVLQGNGNGTFQAATDVTVGSYALYASAPYDIAEGDLNHDGVPDLVVTDWRASTVNVLLGNGDGTFQPPVSYAVGTSPYGVVLADLTGDGALDIITANRDADASHDISILRGNGDGTFQPATYVADGTGTNSVAVADLNGDGKPDLAATNLNDRTLSIMFGNGDGTFQTPINYSTDIDPTQVVVADLNRDGKPDLVVNNYHGSDVGIYLNQGGGSFSVANFYNSASGGVGNQGGPVFADLTGNGILDMLNPSANWFYVALGNGNGTFQNASSVISHDNPAALVVGDMTGDNTPDVAVANGGSMNLRVFRGKGDGTFVQDAVYASAGRSPNDLVAADLTGDGELDLAIVDSGAPTVTIMRNQSPSAIYFNLTALATPRAGVSCPFTITAINSAGQTVTSYSGTVHFTSNDPAAVLPADVRLSNGVGTVSMTFGTSGNEYLRGRDTANPKITGTSHTFAVAGAVVAVDHFSVTVAATTTAGSSLSVTVTALDKSNRPVTGYTGTVHFTSSDNQAALPTNYTFTSGDVGSHVFAVTLKTAGNQSIAVTDAANNAKSGSAAVTVNAAAVSQLTVTGFPNPATAGVSSTFTVAAEDAYGNVNPNYAGTVQFSSSDPQATALPNSALTNGVGTFSITLKTAGAQSITATDAASSSVTGTDNVTVKAAGATTLVASGFPNSVTAGSVAKITVTAFDPFGNPATGYTGTIQFTSSDMAAGLPANSGLTSGVGTFNVTLKTAGTQSITATDTVNKNLTATESNITVMAAATGQFVVAGFPSPVTAGVGGTFAVTAEDAFGNFTPGYAGTIHFSSSDAGASLPANSILTNGTGTFSATLDKAGSQTITATDTASSLITGASPAIVVNPAAADHLLVSTPANVNAGTAFSFTVSALDRFGNIATSYAGTVHFTCSDSSGSLPGDSTLANGSGTFNATLDQLGNQTITATDTATASITGASPGIHVNPALANHFTLSVPSNSMAGSAFDLTVTAIDTFGNTATNYTGTVHFTSSDGNASLPADSTLTNGIGSFSATLTTAGNQTIRATDTVSSSVTGVSPAVVVSPGATKRFGFAMPAGGATAGIAFNFTLVAQDTYGNATPGYNGTVHFSSSDSAAALPADSALSNGVGSFSSTLYQAGNQTITARDVVNSA